MAKRKPMKLDLKEGALHEQMEVDKDKKLPKSKVSSLAKAKVGSTVSVGGKKQKMTAKLKKRAVFAKVAPTWKKGR